MLALACVASEGARAAENRSLLSAVKSRDGNAVRALLAAGADANEADGDGTTALMRAADGNEEEIARLLMEARADVNKSNDYGYSALSLACINANSELVKALLDAGANPNAAAWNGETALMTCSRAGAAAGVEALLKRGAAANAAEPEKEQTALMWAAAFGHAEVVRTLAARGADVHARSKELENYKAMSAITYTQNVFMPEKKGGFTALMFAAQAGRLEAARALVESGARVNDVSASDGPPLVLAASNGHEKVGLYLLEKGADPNAADAYGVTALHWAMQRGITYLYSRPYRTDRFWPSQNSPELAKALLVKGANPNARIAKDFLPWDIHRYARSLSNELPQAGLTGATPYLLAAASGDIQTMRIMLEAKASPSLATTEGLTPLMVAAGVGRDKGASTAQEAEGAREALRLAIQLGGDVNAAGPGGRAAIHGAILLADEEAIRLLVQNGANINAKDKYGQTPMTMALGDPGQLIYKPLPGGETDRSFRESVPNPKMVELLLSLGAPAYNGPIADRSGQ
jgi:ankyrin repeat protein